MQQKMGADRRQGSEYSLVYYYLFACLVLATTVFVSLAPGS